MPVNGSRIFARNESRVHGEAKATLFARRRINLPAYVDPPWPVPERPNYGLSRTGMLEEGVRASLAAVAVKPLLDSRVFVADSVLLEAEMPGFRVDALLESGDERLLVEFRKSHPVSPEKRRKIEASGLPCVEVDVSGLRDSIDLGSLFDSVTGLGACGCPMEWIFHPEGKALAKVHHRVMHHEFDRRLAAARKDLRKAMNGACRKLVHRQGYFGDWVEGCPLHVYKGRHSVSFLPDCVYCEHNIAWFGENDQALLEELTGSPERHVYCGCSDETARAYRAELMKDMEFLRPEDAVHLAWTTAGIALPERLLNDIAWCSRFVEAHPECRRCGKSRMRLCRNQTTGQVFWGCGRYPRCDEAFRYVAVPVLEEALAFQDAERTPAWFAHVEALQRAERERTAMETERETFEADEAVLRSLGLK